MKSTALEQNVSLKNDGLNAVFMQVLTRYGLVILMLLLIIGFSLTTKTFFTKATLAAILTTKSTFAILALAATVTMIVGKIDLNVGFGIVMWHILPIVFIANLGLPWPLACLLVLLIAGLFGMFNGILVAFADIDSFVATLGSGTVLYSLALWITGGRQVVATLPLSFQYLFFYELFGIPIVAFYVLIIAIILWLITEYTPIGRAMYAVGGNPSAAQLNGIPLKKFIIGSFVISSMLTAFTGILISAQFSVGQASVGMDYLLPALVGAFLGSTTIRPGRANIWGTIVGVLILAIGIAGIQQNGGPFFVKSLFNGATLLAAITLAGYAQRKRALNQKTVQKRNKTQKGV